MAILAILSITTTAWSCDACGCSITGSGIGMMTSYRNNYIRLGWQAARYQSVAENSFGSKDYFQLSDLSAQIYLSDRWKIWGNIAYRHHQRNNIQENQQVKGLSDSRIMVTYSLLNHWLNTDGSSWLVDLGLGIKWPTGKYDPKIHDSNLPENFNIGQGNFSLLIEPRIVFTKNELGLALSNHTQINSPSRDGYQYGFQTSANINVFKEFQALGLGWVPQLGGTAEFIQKDHYKNGNNVHGTGGRGLFFNAGLSLKKSNFLIGANYAQPLAQSYSDDEVEASARWAIQVSYVF